MDVGGPEKFFLTHKQLAHELRADVAARLLEVTTLAEEYVNEVFFAGLAA